MQEVKEMTLQFMHTIEGVNTLPNQMLMMVLLKELAEKKGGFKVSLVTTEKKMMSFYRYELMKSERFQSTG